MKQLTSLNILISFITLFILALTALSAQAAEGIINAISFRPIPTQATIAVRPWDNSDENMKTAQLIKTQLKSLGYKIAPNAKITLSFETKNELGKWSRGTKNKSVEFSAEAGSATENDAKVRLNIFSSSEGGILNPAKKSGENILSKISLEITLDQQNGPRLWQGEAVAGVRQTDSASVIYRLTPILVDQLGKTVRRKSVEIP